MVFGGGREKKKQKIASMVALVVVAVSWLPETPPLGVGISQRWGDRKKELELWCTVAAVESKPRCKGLSCGVGLVFSGSRRAFSVNSLAYFDALRRSVQCRYLPSGSTWLGAQVLSTTLTRAQFMLVAVVDFLEDGGLSRCVVFCWWWI